MTKISDLLVVTILCFGFANFSDEAAGFDVRSEFEEFYSGAPVWDSLRFRIVRIVPVSDGFTIVHHLKGRIANECFDLASQSFKFTNMNSEVDVDFEKNRKVQFNESPSFIRNPVYEAEISFNEIGEPSITRCSVFSQNGLRSPMPEIFSCFGDVRRGSTFSELIDDKKTKFISFQTTQVNGIELKCLQVEFVHRTTSSGIEVQWKTKYFFDPDSKICVRQKHEIGGVDWGIIELFFGGNATVDNEKIAVERVETRSTFDKTKDDYVHVISSTEVQEFVIGSEIDEAEFMLTNYGLPEPLIRSNGKWGSWVWCSLIGCVALVATGIYLSKKQGR